MREEEREKTTANIDSNTFQRQGNGKISTNSNLLNIDDKVNQMYLNTFVAT